MEREAFRNPASESVRITFVAEGNTAHLNAELRGAFEPAASHRFAPVCDAQRHGSVVEDTTLGAERLDGG